MNKLLLREKYKTIRKYIKNRNKKDLLIQNKILSLKEYKDSKTIGIYVDYNNEVATKKIIEISINTKVVGIPKISDNNTMNFIKINSINDLNTTNKYKITETFNTTEIPIEKIDVLLIPGICFDKTKSRIGYGGGYYDKYLSKNNKIVKIGLAYSEQISEEIINIDKNDIKMDYIITDKEIIK